MELKMKLLPISVEENLKQFALQYDQADKLIDEADKILRLITVAVRMQRLNLSNSLFADGCRKMLQDKTESQIKELRLGLGLLVAFHKQHPADSYQLIVLNSKSSCNLTETEFVRAITQLNIQMPHDLPTSVNRPQ